MTRNRWLGGALAIGAACGLVGALGVLPAVGQSSPPSSPVVIGRTAKIINRGVAAKAFAYIVCQPGDYAALKITLSERSGNAIVTGKGSVDSINCTGQIETITIAVVATRRPFVNGTAFGKATFFTCGSSFCGNATSTHSVKLRTPHR